nr:ribonuclease H-like domain-containing protein [Tanacetum cinerariifolium]
DDANDEDEEESSDSKKEEEEHLALTVPAPAQYSSVFESDEIEPFEESETAATPPPFGYRIAARISVQPHILIVGNKMHKAFPLLVENTECLVLSKDFKLPDDSMVVLKVPRKHNLYTINLNDLCPRGNLAYLVAHASFDECVKWHRRMAHVNFKNIN